MMASTRWLIGIAAAIAAAIVAAVIVALVAGGARTFPPGTPEHAVQGYLQAVAREDATAAFAYLSADLRQACGDYSREAITNRGDSGLRVTLDGTTIRDDGTALVRVRILESYGGSPFGASESTMSMSFELRQEDGDWRFAQSPWPLYCPKLLPAVPAPATATPTPTPTPTATPARAS